MSVLDVTYKDGLISPGKIWCDEDRHALFENFTDFNEWIDGEDGKEVRKGMELMIYLNLAKHFMLVMQKHIIKHSSCDRRNKNNRP